MHVCVQMDGCVGVCTYVLVSLWVGLCVCSYVCACDYFFSDCIKPNLFLSIHFMVRFLSELFDIDLYMCFLFVCLLVFPGSKRQESEWWILTSPDGDY